MRRVVLLFVIFSAVSVCSGAVITVDDDGPADFNNIQAAIDFSDDGDIIIVQPGIYTGNGNRDIDPNGKEVIIRSIDPNDPEIVAATIIDCNGSSIKRHRGFSFYTHTTNSTIISGLTITNGYGLKEAVSDYPSQIRSVGGAIFCDYESSPTITRCHIEGNEAELSGGGIYCQNNSNPIISYCVIKNNSADGPGGAIYCTHSNPTITHCIIKNNSAGSSGGAIYSKEGGPTISHCTITDNFAESISSILCWNLRTHEPNPKITHSVLWNNTDLEILAFEEGITTFTYCDIKGGWPGEGNIDAEPMLIDTSNKESHLSSWSPCINAGDPCYIGESGEVDIDGEKRIIGGRIDIGADEFLFEAPHIEILPGNIVFSSYKDGADPEPQTVSIRNAGIDTLNWSITESCDWLEVIPATGTSSGENDEVVLNINTTGLITGTYACEPMITANIADNSPQTILITLYVRDSDGLLHVPSEYETIQAAVDVSRDGDVVVLADGIYSGPGNRDIDFVGKGITVRSENGPDNCIIDCEGTETEPHRAFYFHSDETPTSIVDGLTIINGYSPPDPFESGGATLCYNSSPTIYNCRFLNNQATRDGGAIHCRYSDSLITRCIFTNNIAYAGGAICCWSGSPVVENCIIRDNKAVGYISGWGYNLGGGIYSEYYGFITINNCIIINNFAEYAGGGFSTQGINPVKNCTFSGNSSFMGGALHCGEYGYPQIHNCILWDNEAVNGHEIAMCTMDWQSWLSVSYSNIQGGRDEIYDIANLEWGEGNIDVDPLFADVDATDYHLQSEGGRWDANSQNWVIDANTSPCIDAGDWMSPVGFEPFPNGGRVNMGAYGGKGEASKSYFGAEPCEIIIAGDINGDCIVDFVDFAIMALHWQQEEN